MKQICPSGTGPGTWRRTGGRDGNPVNPEIRCHIILTGLPRIRYNQSFLYSTSQQEARR
ncbi:Uncharacterized protein dnm_052900 [Desulfonema magnum]|uniref:Uncharacterized protein n=1 Tax=Desulfonema magnum TaxID=45655 RepID=A0A975BPJ5_9BACT|nr:Uncharacterized protein dnm_052900 [Desulfonema magnum]